MSQGKISAHVKIEAVKQYLEGGKSQRQIALAVGVSKPVVASWIHNYQSMGEDAFIYTKNHKYSLELKLQVVHEYLRGQASYISLAEKYQIRSETIVKRWVKKYNSHEKLKSSGAGGYPIMTKGRKTTLNERIEIVEYCIGHNYNYAETAAKYTISYSQVYSYTKKYESGGVDALQDRRGKKKEESQMNELEKLRLENKLLRAEKKKTEMELNLLKKLQEIERRRG